jgi:hypothetical protein
MRRVLLGYALLAVFCMGCDSTPMVKTATPTVVASPTPQPTMMPTPPPTATPQVTPTISDPALEQLNAAERKWQAAGITSYRIRSLYSGEVYVNATMEIRVENGQTAQATCSSQPKSISACSFLHTEDFTVAGLFERVRGAVSDSTVYVTVKYDAAYGFPRSIFIRSRTSTGGNATVVDNFSMLP